MNLEIQPMKIPKLRKSHLQQLKYYIENHKKWNYYGRKDYFQKRHKDLEEWSDSVLKEFNRKTK